MAYQIELNITDVDNEKKTLKVQGQKVSFGYFEEIIITPILNNLKPSEGVHIMKQLAAAGLRTHIWSSHAREAALAIQAERDAAAEHERQAILQAERMRDMNMTPDEIQKEKQERDAARQAEIARHRNKGAGAFSL